MSLITELKRRNVYRAAVFYAASAWLLVQVATQVFPFFHIAEWVVRWIVVAAVVGFPFLLAFAWFYEWTPEGLKRESEVAPAESITHHTGKKLDRWIIAVLGAAVVLLLTDRFVLHKDAGSSSADNSIAVLPLINESGDANDEYFSDGLSEDLINALTQLNGLRVISRNSSFQIQGASPAIRSRSAAALGVGSLLEGTVRKLGNRLRISAALIHARRMAARSGHRRSTASTRTSSTCRRRSRRPSRRRCASVCSATRRPRSFPRTGRRTATCRRTRLTLQGNFYYDHITKTDFHKAIDYYQQAVKLEPRYALALAPLSLTWTELAGQSGGVEQSEAYANGRATAQQALVLEPNLAKAHDALGWLLLSADWNLAGAQAEFVKAEALAPDDAFAKNGLAAVLSDLGRQDEAVAMQSRAVALDPLHAHYRIFLASYLVALGRLDEGEASIRRGQEIQPGELAAYAELVVINVLRGDAAAALRDAELETEPTWKRFSRALALFASGDRTAADAALQELIVNDAEGASFQIASVYAYRKDADKAFEWLDRALVTRDGGVVQMLSDPFLMSFRSDPRFAAFCRKVGLPVPGEQSAPAVQAQAAEHKA